MQVERIDFLSSLKGVVDVFNPTEALDKAKLRRIMSFIFQKRGIKAIMLLYNFRRINQFEISRIFVGFLRKCATRNLYALV